MSSGAHLLRTLAQAQDRVVVTHSQAVDARRELLRVQEWAFVAHTQLRKLRDEASRTDMSEAKMLGLNLAVAELNLETCRTDERRAKVDLIRAEGQVKIAKFEVAEAELEYDNFLLSSGQLKVMKGPYLDSPLGRWRAELDVTLDQPLTMEALPTPPLDADTDGNVKHLVTCKSRRRARMPSRGQCDCAIKSAFLRPCLKREGGQVNLRTERLRWQPNLFAPEMQAQAQAVLDLVEGMFQSARRVPS